MWHVKPAMSAIAQDGGICEEVDAESVLEKSKTHNTDMDDAHDERDFLQVPHTFHV